MEKNRFLEICLIYDEILEYNGFIKQECSLSDDLTNESSKSTLSMNHIRWMINEIPRMIDDPNKKEKANRWIGFIQGILWINGYYSINDMRGHTGSKKEIKKIIKERQKIIKDEYFYPFEGGITEIGI